MTDKIKSYELFHVEPRWLFLRIETEKGFVGWGEPNLEGYSDVVAAAVAAMMEEVTGSDPSRIQQIWQRITKSKFYGASGPVLMSALAGIDQALWDIKGKKLNAPVHELIGGAVRDRMLVYRWCGGDNNSPEDAAREAKLVIENSNFKNLKMNACGAMPYVDTDGVVQKAAERMAAVREAVGPNIGVALDFHGRCKLPMARKLMKALEPYNPLFFEEPLAPQFNDRLPELQNVTHIPIATGERMYIAQEFRELLHKGGAAIVQADVSHCGGITHLLDISRLAEQYDVALAPHCPLGPLALASCLQVDFCSINAVFQECSLGIHYNSEGSDGGADILDYVLNKEVFDVDEHGYMKLPDNPGLGVEINENAVRKASEKGHNWRDRAWFLPDGAPTKW